MTKEEVIQKIKEDECFLEDNKEFIENRDFAKQVLSINGLQLFYFPNFQDDKELVEVAVQSSVNAIVYASNRLKEDKTIIKKLFEKSSICFLYLKDELVADLDFMNELFYNNQNPITEKFLKENCNHSNQFMRLSVSIYPKFYPKKTQIKKGLKDKFIKVREIYQLRQEEWIADIENKKLSKLKMSC